MSTAPRDPLEILKALESRGLARASEFFAHRDQDEAAQTEAHGGGADSDAAAGKPATPQSRAARAFERLFPHAERIECSDGGCRLVRAQAPLCGTRTRPHGYRCPVEPWGGPPSCDTLAALTGDARWAALDPTRIVYLDTETTSLAGASGTYTFLIGLGRYEPGLGAFTVEQFFMEDYLDEGGLVEAVERALDGAQALVSYNGRTFDVPLLEARWRMQRRRPRFPELHLDLLHYARRLWRLRLPDCSLGTVERAILGIERLSDVDGSWVPQIYFDFVRGVRPERIVPVFDHHAQDIFSLAALVSAMARAFLEPEDSRFAHASDQWGLARIYDLAGRAHDALGRLEAAVLAARDEDLGFRMAMHLARRYKRCGRAEDACAIWQARAAQARAGRLDPLIELAKYAEHALRDLDAARRWAEQALGLARREELEALERRLGRLERRAARPTASRKKIKT